MDPSTTKPTSPLTNSPLEPSQTPELVPIPSILPPTPSKPVIDLKKIPYRSGSFWLVILLVLNLFLFGYFWLIPLISPTIRIKDQPLSARIHVDKLSANTSGFLVLRAQVDAPPGLTVAKTSLIIPDTYYNFDLGLEGESLLPEDTARVIPGTVVTATFYKDMDKNGIYTSEIDTEVATDIFGNKSQTTFIIKSSL